MFLRNVVDFERTARRYIPEYSVLQKKPANAPKVTHEKGRFLYLSLFLLFTIWEEQDNYLNNCA
jgi:hypothetical protein